MPEEFLKRFEALEGEVKSLEEAIKGLKLPEPKPERETGVCPWCGQLASRKVLDRKAEEAAKGKPLVVLERERVVERPVEKIVEKPVEKVVKEPVREPIDLEALARKVFKPGSLTPEAGEALKALYEAGRREGLFK
jgi:hypothetical protein